MQPAPLQQAPRPAQGFSSPSPQQRPPQATRPVQAAPALLSSTAPQARPAPASSTSRPSRPQTQPQPQPGRPAAPAQPVRAHPARSSQPDEFLEPLPPAGPPGVDDSRIGRKFEAELDWWYVSKKRVFRALMILVVGVSAYFGVKSYIEHGEKPEIRVPREIAEAENLLEKAKLVPGANAEDLTSAQQKISQAHQLLDNKSYDAASTVALEAQRIARTIGDKTPRGDAVIVESGGKVEVQHPNRTSWETAHQGMKLFEGDFVKTGPNGMADIMAADGTLYKVKPETLFEVRRTSVTPSGGEGGELEKKSGIKFVIGQVDVNTGDGTKAIINTDSADAVIPQKSRVGMDVDRDRNTGISTFDGEGVTFSTKGGEHVTVGARERVTAANGKLGTKVRLPDAPSPMTPEDNAVYDMRKKEPVTLKWSPAPDALRYRIQIARSRLFIPDSIIVDKADRTKPEIMLSVQDEGSFFWRVATLGKQNLASEWSAYRRFKMQSGTEGDGRIRKAPPDLVVERPQVIANIVTVKGRTDSGASVTVNGEPAEVDASGNFKKIISVSQEGLVPIVVRAVNGAGLVTEKTEKALIQTF